MNTDERREWLRCSESTAYFLDTYTQVYDATSNGWLPFKLWPAQARTLRAIGQHRLLIILKARQLGLTWLLLGFALWEMIFRPAATELLFSRRDDEAVNLLDFRLKGMYRRLPDWAKVRSVIKDNEHEWRLSNGSAALAFPTTAGDSYTATTVIADEFDLVPNQGQLMGAVKPTIDAGGRMILLSRVDKSKPESQFKQIYRAAKAGANDWVPIFLPWQARPDRDAAWYEAQRRDSESRTGALDELHEQYPATDTEALAPRTLDKRIAPVWLANCYAELPALGDEALRAAEAPAIPGLQVFKLPVPGARYVLGADPAEGNPTSDDSALDVQDLMTGEEMAVLAGKFQPSALAAFADQVGTFFNQADLMVERNNHGHAVILWLLANSKLRVLSGYDGREGWLSSQLGKSLLYDAAADAFRDKDTLMHSFPANLQLASIEGSTLRAPEGQADDRADAYALANVGRPYALAADGDRTGEVVVDEERVEISDY